MVDDTPVTTLIDTLSAGATAIIDFFGHVVNDKKDATIFIVFMLVRDFFNFFSVGRYTPCLP